MPDFSCRHRGPVLRQDYCGCGGEFETIDVHACGVYGECTVHSAGRAIVKSDKTGRVPSCVACVLRQRLVDHL